MEKAKTIAANAAVIAVISLVLIWGNTLHRQHAQFDKGERAYKVGDFVGAVAGYEAAIHMYVPGSSVVETSARKLWEIAQTYEARGDAQRALIAYRALRSSFYAAKWLVQPGEDWIRRSDERIAVLVPLQKGR